MSGYHISLLIVAAVTALIAWRVPRAKLWIGALAASFVVSVTYLYLVPQGYGPDGSWRAPASLIAGLCDASVAAMIYWFGKRRWETVGLYSLVLLSVAVNLLYATGELFYFPPIPPREVYAIILEIINYAALLLIGGTGILNRIGAGHGIRSSGRVVAGVRMARDALQKESRPSKPLRG